MRRIASFFHGIVGTGNSLQDLFLLAIRIYWGYLFYMSGAHKLENLSGTIGFFEKLSIPFPLYMAHFVAWLELAGGIALIVGFATRIVAIPLSITMIVALITAHTAGAGMIFTDPQKFLAEAPVTFLLVSVALFCFGPGKVSIDALFDRVGSKSKS